MTKLLARDLMTADVVTVPPQTPVVAMARLLSERGISAVPVLEADGSVAGIVTEADLIRRLAGEADKPASWLASLFASPAREAETYARTHGVTAADIMTVQVVSVAPDTLASDVAHRMEEEGVRRVLVTEGGQLRGLVSRADLLRALVAPAPDAAAVPDERIRMAVIAAMKNQPWTDMFLTLVDVKDGVVEFHGFSRSAAVQRGLRVLAENVPGVRGVLDNTQPMPAALYASV